ncbi:MAG: galactosyldiacylglycerol synthase, partial [Proteobacteria bacterium]|nr:galactosyldiacylglycerol synthase [Pseudomonadota bacterium]
MSQKKILLLSVSAGAGHMRAAEAIRQQALTMGGEVNAVHWDVMDFVSAAFRKVYTDFYIKLVNKAPALWGYLYQASNDAHPGSAMEKLRRGVERLNTRALRKEIESLKPDAIVCTHFLPAEILSRMMRESR